MSARWIADEDELVNALREVPGRDVYRIGWSANPGNIGRWTLSYPGKCRAFVSSLAIKNALEHERVRPTFEGIEGSYSLCGRP